MNIKKLKIRYILIAWLIIYILVSLFKYIKIKSLIYNRYGIVSKTFSTRMYINESVLFDGAMLIVGFPILLLTGGWNFTQWAYSDVKLNLNQKLTTYIELKPKFMKNKFSVTMRGGQIVSDTFYETLINDTKFQHLYSNWVKKQVGIDDENVEFEFAGNYDTPYIEFDKIKTLSKDYREIFENTHNLYLDTVIVNDYSINEKNYINCFNIIKDDIYIKCYHITGKPDKKYTLFVYINNYRFMYHYPEEEIVNISKKNENPQDYGGAIWSDVTIE